MSIVDTYSIWDVKVIKKPTKELTHGLQEMRKGKRGGKR